ncbi:MAG: hypothetical protein HKO06_00515 [Pseudomonadales bacterium]|nr:hypothetical protein [Pseudomonadales bacterium]
MVFPRVASAGEQAVNARPVYSNKRWPDMLSVIILFTSVVHKSVERMVLGQITTVASVLLAFAGGFCSQLCFAQAPLWGGALSSSYHYERYDESEGLDGEAFTLDVSGYVAGTHWSAGVYLPWQSGDGVATIRQSTLQLFAQCRKLVELAKRDGVTLLALATRVDTVRQLIVQCQRLRQRDFFEQEKISGLNDVSLDIGYGLSLGERVPQFFSVTAVLTADNGDVDRGLGSGTVDSALDLLYVWDWGKYEASVGAGYNFILGGRLADLYENYGYGSLDVERSVGNGRSNVFSIGLGGNWSQASLPGADDSRSLNMKVRYRFADGWQLKTAYTNYLNLDGYPEHEYSLGLSFSY